MAVLKDFHGDIFPNVQGCPTGVLNNALRSTLIDFCRASRLWKLESPLTDVTAGEPRYKFSPQDGVRVVTVDYAAFEGSHLTKTSQHDLDQDGSMRGWRDMESTSPNKFYIDNPDMLRLVPTPSEDKSAALKLFVSVTPTRDASDVPDWLYEDWGTTIAHGTLARLHAMANRVWADPSLVAFHDQQYRAGLSRAKTRAMKSLLTIGKTMLPQSFLSL